MLSMYRRTPFAVDEWYHCYSRGIEKRNTFESSADYNRFLDLLYLANDTAPVDRGSLRIPSVELFQRSRKRNIVSIGSYCLMPNHFHILIREITDGGITAFMRKLGTGYTMYFNLKNARIGNLFVKPFRSKHIGDDRYLRHVAQYIHLNAAALFEPKIKTGDVKTFDVIERKMKTYRYSSFVDYSQTERRPQQHILDKNAIDLIGSDLPTMSESLQTATTYRAGLDL